jgi:hypothetical protein
MKETPIYNAHEQQLEEKNLKMVDALARLMHEGWRKDRFNPDTETYAPRIKTVKDAKWISEHGGVTEVDIANTPFEQLPSDWQEENYLSAKVAVGKLEEILYLIHDKWLDRNDSYASNEQKTQYSRLSATEQLKDIEILEEAIQIIKERSS